MSDYDFKTLNDKEFEILVTDLLTKRDGQRYERFKPGRDRGVDGRFFKPDGTEVILQCKHRPSSSLERLTKHLADVELPKIHRLKPGRYILAISHPLSRVDKERISDVLSPYVNSPADILGREDLNDLLANNIDVELRHYKLWISSTNVLRYHFNKPIQDRSAFLMAEIQESTHLYVPTMNHERALEKLEKLGAVIITGPAGIGKTTLAEHLVLHYVSKGFSPIQIAEEIKEAEAVYQRGERQVFYFDDFLGRNYLEALSGHEGSHIVGFIKRIGRDRDKKFILTSRTTILNHGKVLIDVFQNNNIERNEFEVSFDSFSEMDKAQILYNHIWHSNLEPEYIDELYAQKRYRKIISHRNYNPRIIKYITGSEYLSERPCSQYWEYVQSLLNNPAKVWQNPFEAQHDDFGRALILLVTLNSRAISHVDLSESYARFISHPDAGGMQGNRDFLKTLRHLVGSMLSRVLNEEGGFSINLFNPSIGDFVLRRYASDMPSLRAGFCSLRSLSSIKTLLNLSKNNLIDTESRKSLLIALLNNARAVGYVGYAPEYIALVLVNHPTLTSGLLPQDEAVVDAARFIVQSDCPDYFGDVADIMHWCFVNELVTERQVTDFIAQGCDLGASSEELAKLALLARKISHGSDSHLWVNIESAAVTYFTDAIYDEFPDEEVFDSVDPDNSSEARCNLSSMIEQKMGNLGIPYSDSTVEAIAEAFDVSARMEEYFSPEPEYDNTEARTYSWPQVDAIDDLFDRSQ